MANYKIAVDVQYDDARQLSRAAAVVFQCWKDVQPNTFEVHEQRVTAPYERGQFYLRELPAILPVVTRVRESFELSVVLVDGYVDLDAGRPGLGRHLFDALGQEVTVVGVAKTEFRGAPARPVLRGRSRRPLWVTSTADAEEAARAVAIMHGRFREPTLLKLADHHARGLV